MACRGWSFSRAFLGLQFISKNYPPKHPDLFKLSDSQFDPTFLSQFRAGATELVCVHPYVYTFR